MFELTLVTLGLALWRVLGYYLYVEWGRRRIRARFESYCIPYSPLTRVRVLWYNVTEVKECTHAVRREHRSAVTGYLCRHYGWIIEVSGMASILYLTCKGVRWLVERVMSLDEGVYGGTPEELTNEKVPVYKWQPRYRWYSVTLTLLSWAGLGVLAFVMPPWYVVPAVAAATISGWKLTEYLNETEED